MRFADLPVGQNFTDPERPGRRFKKLAGGTVAQCGDELCAVDDRGHLYELDPKGPGENMMFTPDTPVIPGSDGI